jgi:hypothetical protein
LVWYEIEKKSLIKFGEMNSTKIFVEKVYLTTCIL